MSHIPRQAVGLIRFHYTQKDTVCTEGNAGRPRPRLSFSVRSAPGGSVCPDFSVPALPRGSVQICMERFIPSRKGSRRHGTIDMVSANPDIISTSRIWLLEHRPGNTRGGFFVHRADCRCVHGALLVLTSLRRSVTILQQTPGGFFVSMSRQSIVDPFAPFLFRQERCPKEADSRGAVCRAPARQIRPLEYPPAALTMARSTLTHILCTAKMSRFLLRREMFSEIRQGGESASRRHRSIAPRCRHGVRTFRSLFVARGRGT